MSEKSATEKLDQQLEKFAWFERESKKPAWVLPLRKAGLARFAELGFPTLKDEDYRFTNVAPVTRLPFNPALEPTGEKVSAEQIAAFPLTTVAAHRLVFVNGHFAPELSSPAWQQPGVIVKNLAAALVEDSALIEQHLGNSDQADSFASLNTAYFRDGGFIHIAAGKSAEQPIHLVFVSTVREAPVTSHPRNLIIAEKSSHGTVIESYSCTADATYFTNAVTQLIVGENAVLEHCKFQDEAPSAFHIAAIHARLAKRAQLAAHSLATGARLSRNNIRTHLGGEGIECILNGLYLTHGEQLADHHMVVEHAAPRCASHEYYNGILDGKSRGVFHGRILVRRPAQKTDAKQTNKNLLLSDDATADTKPQLEIYADDVKCTHGATIGQLNEESIFYLRTRGLGMDTARRMLIHAFAGEIIERVRHRPLREELDRIVWDRLEANPHVGEAK